MANANGAFMATSVSIPGTERGRLVFAYSREGDLRSFSRALSSRRDGPHLHATGNGLDCLQLLLPGAGALSTPMPWLCVIDFHLPGVDGLHILGRVRADPLLQRMPVVVTARESDRGVVEPSYMAGANSCVLLPEDPALRSECWARVLEYWLTTSVNPMGRSRHGMPGGAECIEVA